MDIILQTNTDDPYLAFREIVKFGDASGYGAMLAVRSGWLSADYCFYFEVQPLLTFLAEIELIDRTLTGVARLKPIFEDQFVEFQGAGLGHVWVRGDLIDHGTGQRVWFVFRTDQTCLRPFMTAFRQLTE